MATKNRGQTLEPTDVVNLRTTFKNQFGQPADLDNFPTISIVSPSDSVILSPTSAGIMRESAGKYVFQYTVPLSPSLGVYTDIWVGTMGGFRIESAFNFVITATDLARSLSVNNSDGYIALGDDPGFHYSQVAILNVNKLMKTLRARLRSGGKALSKDKYGNPIYVDCDIFTVDMLATFLANALTDFNQVPFFTFISFEDTAMIDQFHDIIVEGGTLMALASQALVERGREFQITDNGINFTPPSVSELLNTEYGTLLTNYYDKLKYIKNSLRSAPKGLGTLRPLGASPQLLRLRHLRARQII